MNPLIEVQGGAMVSLVDGHTYVWEMYVVIKVQWMQGIKTSRTWSNSNDIFNSKCFISSLDLYNFFPESDFLSQGPKEDHDPTLLKFCPMNGLFTL